MQQNYACNIARITCKFVVHVQYDRGLLCRHAISHIFQTFSNNDGALHGGAKGQVSLYVITQTSIACEQ